MMFSPSYWVEMYLPRVQPMRWESNTPVATFNAKHTKASACCSMGMDAGLYQLSKAVTYHISLQNMRFEYRFDREKLDELQASENASYHIAHATSPGSADIIAELNELKVGGPGQLSWVLTVV